MEISVQEKKENPLLKRTEVEFSVAFDGATPSRTEVKARLCAILKANPDFTVIGEIGQGFGAKVVTGTARVYTDAAGVKLESPYRMRRERGEKGRPAKAAKAAVVKAKKKIK